MHRLVVEGVVKGLMRSLRVDRRVKANLANMAKARRALRRKKRGG